MNKGASNTVGPKSNDAAPKPVGVGGHSEFPSFHLFREYLRRVDSTRADQELELPWELADPRGCNETYHIDSLAVQYGSAWEQASLANSESFQVLAGELANGALKAKHHESSELDVYRRRLEAAEKRAESAERRADEQLVRAESLQTIVRQLREDRARDVRSWDQLIASHESFQKQAIGHLVDRSRANDVLLAQFVGPAAGELLFTESYEGFITSVSDDEVVVLYETSTDEFSHIYERSQFKDQRLPGTGQRLALRVYLSRLTPDAPSVQDKVQEGEDDDAGELIRGSIEL